MHARKSLDCLERTVGGNVKIKGHSLEISHTNKEHAFRNQKKVDPYYKVSKNLAEFCTSVLGDGRTHER